jgi:hypothetical protein
VSEDPTITRSLWHRFTLGSGPLKRSTDRIQVLARVLLLLAVLTAVPIALAVGTATGSSMRTTADTQAASRHQVDATLLEEAVAPLGSDPERAVRTAKVQATWIDATGAVRDGLVRAPVGAEVGSTVTVWIDDSGAVTTAPMKGSQVVGQAVLASLATFAGLTITALLAYIAVRRLLERGRMRRWGDDWSVVEPVWSGKVP